MRVPAVQSFEVNKTMNPGPVVAGAIAAVLLWLYIFFGDKLSSKSRTPATGMCPFSTARTGADGGVCAIRSCRRGRSYR